MQYKQFIIICWKAADKLKNSRLSENSIWKINKNELRNSTRNVLKIEEYIPQMLRISEKATKLKTWLQAKNISNKSKLKIRYQIL